MTVTIELSPEIQARLEEEAARQGLDVERFIRSMIEQHFVDQVKLPDNQRPFHERASAAEWTREFLAWVDSHKDLKLIPLSNESLRREYMYEDRGR